MNRAFVVYLLLHAAFAAGRNISVSIGTPPESPAGVTYVDGKAPDNLKAGPTKNSTKSEERIAQAAFIRSGTRDIPKDDEIENEEFERFIKTHLNRPTIETVFVSSSPSPLYDEESEEFKEESSSLRSQAEFFKQPAKNQTFERSVALPTLGTSIHPPLDHGHGHFNLAGGGITYGGGDGIILQGDGGQYLPTYQDIFGGGDQQFYQISQAVPSGIPAVVAVPSPVPRTINVAQHGLKTKTFEIRRPAIQKHYYDIEERVIIRPAGSIVVELNRPVAKIPTGETVVNLGGLQGAYGGAGFLQSQGAIGIGQAGIQGGISGIGLQQSQGGISLSQDDLLAIQQSIAASQGGISGIGIQQSQGGGGGGGIQQSQQSIGVLQGGSGGVGIQQNQGGIDVSQGGLQGGLGGLGGAGGVQQSQQGIGISQGGQAGVGIQQSQGGITSSTTPSITIGGPQGGIPGPGPQQSQQGISVSQGGNGGVGFQQSQGGTASSTAPSNTFGGPQGGFDFQQSQQGIGVTQAGNSGVGFQQSQGGTASSTTPSTTFGGPQGGIPGSGFQQSQQGIGVSQGGIAGVGIQQSQGGTASSTAPSNTFGGPQGGFDFQQSQQGIGVSQAGNSGVGIQQSQGGIASSTTPSITFGGPQGGIPGSGFQQSQQGIGVLSQGGITGVGIQQSQGGAVSSTTPSIPTFNFGGPQGGFIGFQQSPGGAIYATTLTSYNPSPNPTISLFGGPQGGVSYTTTFGTPASSIGIGGGILGSGFQQSQGAIGVSQGGQGGISGIGIQQSQGGVISSTTTAPYLPPALPTPTVSIGGGFQQSQGGVSVSTTLSPPVNIGSGFQQSQQGIGVTQGGTAGIGIQQSQGGSVSSTTPSYGVGGGFQQSQQGIGVTQGGTAGIGIQQSQGGIASSTTPSYGIGGGFQQSQQGIGVTQGGTAGIGIQQSQGGVGSSTTPGPFIPPSPGFPTYPLPSPQQPYPSVSSTTASSIAAGIGSDDSIVVEANSNVRNRGTISSTTTTQRSFTSTVNQDASAFARAASSTRKTPFMISVGEPDFHYPPYVEISSRGSPLGHLQLVPATSQTYPRMRYQGQLLTGEVRTDDGYGALSQQNAYESQAHVAEIPPNTKYDEQSVSHPQPNTQYHYVGSSRQPLRVAQVSGNAHQQPAQVYRHHFIGTTSRPITIAEISHQQHAAQPSVQVAKYSQPAQVYEVSQEHVSQQPIQTAKYSQQVPQIYQQPIQGAHSQQQHAAQYRSGAPQRTNLVAQIRHQQQHAAQLNQQQQDEQNRSNLPQERVAEVTQQPNEVHSSTPNRQYQYQPVSTTHQPETFTTGRRLYQQSFVPSKYTQHHTINVAPSQHSIFFNKDAPPQENSGRSQKLEIPPETEEASVQSTNIESSTSAAVISSTSSRSAEQAPQQTYASVLANSPPGILYASSPVQSHQTSHPQHILRFNSEGSSLFSPSGRHLHLMYSQPPRAAYSQQPASRHQISLNNEGLQAQIPISHQRQIQLSATNTQQSKSHDVSLQTSARYEATTSTTPSPASTITHRRQQKYRNEQTKGSLTLRSGRTYGDHRVIASTPAPSDGGAASESVQTRRIVVNHPFQTVQEVVEQEPITKYQQITVNEPAQVQSDGLQQDQQKASYRHPAAAYKAGPTYNHPVGAVSYHHGGSH